MRGSIRVLATVALFLLVPVAAQAQATLSGLVRDTSGAVLPGVTVEASSPVLIEKTRSTTTDGNGRYSIPDLRPGTYRVSFTLSGFTTSVRPTVELTCTNIFTVNADLAVGNVQETVTVTSDAPLVNLETTTRQAVMDQELVTAIPSSRTPFTVGVLIPGVKKGAFMSQDVGGSVVQEVASLEANGGRTNDQRMMVNGVALSSMISGGWGGGAVPNATGTSEFAIDVSAVDAQAATGGVRINFIPRDGGNRFSGTLFGSYAGESFVGDNFTDSDVKKAGLTAPNTIKRNGDFNPGFGGPLRRDSLWFFVSGRYLFAENLVAGLFHNANVNNLARYDYVPTTQQAVLHQDQQIAQVRLTWQANQKNKVGVTADFENFCACTTGIGAGIGGAVTAPEAGNDRRFPLQRFVTVDWNSPVSNRLLLEASGIHRVERWGGMHPQVGKAGHISGLTPGIVSVTDNPNPVTGGSLTYRSAAQFNNSWNWTVHYRAALSYITGSHTFKVGFNNAYGHHENNTYTDPATPYSYSFAGGIPTGMTYRIAPRTVRVNVNRDMGIFVQDRWATGRWTLSGALRYDNFVTSFPAQSVGPTSLAPNLNVQYAEQDGINLKDITTRMGATYDVFGNGKTAIKVTLGKYLEGIGTTGGFAAVDNSADNDNPIRRLNTQDTRTWNDSTFAVGDPRRGNFVPDCNLVDYTANGECGALSNAATFGVNIPNINYDPDVLRGWGKRVYNWEFTTTIQHELMPRLGVELQYARRWYGNLRVADDLAVTRADYDQFSFVAPADPRLPGGGGQTFTAFDLRPGAAAQNLLVTFADKYGKMTENFDGLNLTDLAPAERHQRAGRLRHGPPGHRRLRGGRAAAGDDADPVQPVAGLRLRDPSTGTMPAEQRLAHVSAGAGLLHHSEGGRAGQRDVPEPSGRSTGGQRQCLRRRTDPRPVLGRQHDARPRLQRRTVPRRQHRQRRRGVHRAVEPDRPAILEDRSRGGHADPGQLRLLQRDELEFDHQRERHLRGGLANASVNPAPALVQDQRAAGLVAGWALGHLGAWALGRLGA